MRLAVYFIFEVDDIAVPGAYDENIQEADIAKWRVCDAVSDDFGGRMVENAG